MNIYLDPPARRRPVRGSGGLALAAALSLGACATTPQDGRLGPPEVEARWSVNGEPLVVASHRGFGGAVSSIRFRGVEFIDAADHGRLLQGAISFDGHGECDNPTLAGASSDKPGRTASRLLAASAGPARYATVTRMAYWLRPGQTCTAPDGGPMRARNRARLSDVVYSQTFTPAWGGRANAVHTRIAFTTARPRARAVVEAMTAYAPARFSVVHTYDPARGRLQRDAAGAIGEQPHPIVLATPDGASALGLLSLTQDPRPGYGRFAFEGVSKINLVFRPEGPFAAGVHPYDAVWIVGTLAEVEASLRALAPPGA